MFAEIHRVLKQGGVNAFTVWKHVGWVEPVQAAVATLPGCPPIPSADAFRAQVQGENRWHEEEYIHKQLEKHSFTNIQMLDRPETHTFDAELFATTFGGPLTKAMLGSFWSKEDVDKYAGQLTGALRDNFAAKNMEAVSFIMHALVVVAHKE